MTAAVASVLGVWIVSSAAHNLRHRMYSHNSLWAPRNVSAGVYGMALAHAGVGVLVIGIGFTSAYTVEKDLRMSINDEYVLNGYQYRFEGVSTRQGPNYTSLFGEISVLKDGHDVAQLYPEKRTYLVQDNPMTEPGIDVGLFRDLYVVLGERLDNNDTWSIRIYHNSFVRWIWLGPLIMALGGLLAALDVRYRKITLLSRKESSRSSMASETNSWLVIALSCNDVHSPTSSFKLAKFLMMPWALWVSCQNDATLDSFSSSAICVCLSSKSKTHHNICNLVAQLNQSAS